MWAFEEEIEEGISLGDFRSSDLVVRPPYRYQGEIQLTEDTIKLVGEDKESGKDCSILILRNQVTDIHLGYDQIFRRWKEWLTLGSSLQPLRVKWEKDDSQETIYLFVGFVSFPRSSKNEEWLSLFEEWID